METSYDFRIKGKGRILKAWNVKVFLEIDVGKIL